MGAEIRAGVVLTGTIARTMLLISKMTNPNLFHQLPPGPHPPKKIYCFVEIPKGGSNKYEYNIETGAFYLDRVLYEAIFYPTEYGFIPQTWSVEDQDALDIMVLSTQPTFPGCLITAQPIGVLKMIDSGEKDYKIIAVPCSDPRLNHIKNLSGVNPHFKKEVESFWTTYAQLEPQKKIKILGWSGVNKACEIIESAIEAYKEKFKPSP